MQDFAFLQENKPTPNPSQEGNFPDRVEDWLLFPSWEGLGVGKKSLGFVFLKPT
ncbi:hypothetical protein KSU1_C0528 [Candidatus Jettenia caeni]|uniref:Uncharacterized protein n=1 Tax=Candidatus Jettenia caeni TaxID=247490 RepID=I3IK79_9BACT|nr:hypothetical protein KSU1_C0528 [Candidatus Jettenia caeni]